MHQQSFTLFTYFNLQSAHTHSHTLIAHQHLLVRATNERFLPVGGTFRVGLASESH
jgi:hypothetical protein